MNVNEIASLRSNVKPVIQNENCAVLMLNDATGEGVMTVYRVMPGVMICFSDMHMEQCASENELRLDNRENHKGTTYYPLKHYHRVSIFMEVVRR